MAALYITEYAEAKIIDGRMIPVGVEPPLTVQKVAIGGASAQSAALNAKTKFVELHADAICSYKVGTNPTATANDTRMAANTTKFIGVGEANLKIANITNT